MAKPPKELLDAIHESLAERPLEWRYQELSARHAKSGVYIWMGASPTFLTVSIPVGSRASEDYGNDWPLAMPWQRKLRRAAFAARRASGWAPPEREAADLAASILRAASNA